MKFLIRLKFLVGLAFGSVLNGNAQSLEAITNQVIPKEAQKFKGIIRTIEVEFFAGGDAIALKGDQVSAFVQNKLSEWIKNKPKPEAADDPFAGESGVEIIPVFLVAVLTYRIEGESVPRDFQVYRRAIGIASGAELDVALSERGLEMDFCGVAKLVDGDSKILRLQKVVTIDP